MIKKIQNIKGTVEYLLANYPETRDSDRMLILKVWAIQNPSLRNPLVSFRVFADDFLKENDVTYAEPESIRRARQKLQEKNPSLRGESYTQRNKLGVQMKTEIQNLSA